MERISEMLHLEIPKYIAYTRRLSLLALFTIIILIFFLNFAMILDLVFSLQLRKIITAAEKFISVF